MMTYLASLIRFADLIYVAFAPIVLFTRYNSIHATCLAFECCYDCGVTATTFHLQNNRKISERSYFQLTG